jgi:hypothetical protein
MMTGLATTAMEPYWNAELEYRRELAQSGLRSRRPRRGRRSRVPRRPGLKLPHPRRRPLAVA